MTLDELIKKKERLEEDLKLARERMEVSKTDAGKLVIKEIERAISDRRKRYLRIDTHQHMNMVISELSALQGRETELHEQKMMWQYAKNVHSRIDKELQICNKAIIEKRNSQKQRRITDE